MSVGQDSWRLPTAVVVGIDLNGLGVVRSLGRADVPTIVLDTNLSKSTAATRFGRKILVPELSGGALIDSLLRLAAGLSQKPVLLLTQEDSVATVAAAQDKLAGAYRFSMPNQDVMHTLMDKALFQAAAEKLGAPIPRSLVLTDGVAPAAIEALRYPCVVKPLAKVEAYSVRFKKAYRVSNAAEVVQLWSQMRSVIDQVIVQEWIEGGDSDVYFCLQYRHPGLRTVSFVGRKVLQWPPLVGGTASCAPAPDVHHELVSLTNRFFDAVGFVGLGSMEYKRDANNHQFYMVEPTVGRTDYQEEVATLNGVNIPFAAYCGETGRQIPGAVPVHPPRVWRDSISCQKARSVGALDTLSSLAPTAKIVDAYFRANDPLPSLLMKLEPFQRRFQRLTGSR